MLNSTCGLRPYPWEEAAIGFERANRSVAVLRCYRSVRLTVRNRLPGSR
jgi:hypothetical protein